MDFSHESVHPECPNSAETISGIRFDLARELVQQLGDANLKALLDAAQGDDPTAVIRFGEALLLRLLMPQAASYWTWQPSLNDIKNAISRHLGLTTASSPVPTVLKPTPGFATPREIVGQIVPGAAHGDGLLRSSALSPRQLPETLPWREYAAEAGFRSNLLKRGEREILDMASKVLIRLEGWGPSDSQRYLRTECPIVPARMANHGGRLSERSYQRGLKDLISLNLLIVNSISTRGARNVTPAWWAGVSTTDPAMVWRLAARLQEERAVDN